MNNSEEPIAEMERTGQVRIVSSFEQELPQPVNLQPNDSQVAPQRERDLEYHRNMQGNHELQLVQRSKSEHCQNLTIAIIIYSVFSFKFWNTLQDPMKSIAIDYVEIWYYVNSSIFLYMLQILYHWWGMYFTSVYNLRRQQICNIGLFAIGIAVTSYGIHHVWSQRFADLLQDERNKRENFKKPGKYDELSKNLQWLIWLRLWTIIFFGVLVACVGIYVIIACMFGNRGDMEQNQERLQRIPGVNQFILSKSRQYDPTKGQDAEVSACAICLEDFDNKDGKPVAELGCDQRHLFHVECLTEWVKKNDICPMCRQKIPTK